MNKILCWALCTAALVILVGCEKPPEEDIQRAIDEITGDPETPVDPIPDLTEGDTTPPPADPPPVDPPPEDPPPVDPPPPVEVDRFDFQFEVAKIWSYIEGRYTQCPRLLNSWRRYHQACFVYIGQIWGPTDYSLKKIKFTKNKLRIYWGTGQLQVVDKILFNSNRTSVEVTTVERVVDHQPQKTIGNLWVVIPMTFENNPVETFNGRIYWNTNQRILVFKASNNSIKIFTY